VNVTKLITVNSYMFCGSNAKSCWNSSWNLIDLNLWLTGRGSMGRRYSPRDPSGFVDPFDPWPLNHWPLSALTPSNARFLRHTRVHIPNDILMVQPFCRAHYRDRPTDRLTDRQTTPTHATLETPMRHDNFIKAYFVLSHTQRNILSQMIDCIVWNAHNTVFGSKR